MNKEKVKLKTKIISFLKRNPNPKDSQVHRFAKRNKYSVDDVEEGIYRLATKYAKKSKGGK